MYTGLWGIYLNTRATPFAEEPELFESWFDTLETNNGAETIQWILRPTQGWILFPNCFHIFTFELHEGHDE